LLRYLQQLHPQQVIDLEMVGRQCSLLTTLLQQRKYDDIGVKLIFVCRAI
jgi:hypothetical protein